jgi:hypothetical protein
MAMRVLIRSRERSTFLADGQEWVPARDRALDFVSSVLALDAATRMKLKGIEIVLDFGSNEIVLNVPDESKNPPRVG